MKPALYRHKMLSEILLKNNLAVSAMPNGDNLICKNFCRTIPAHDQG